jgi:hypothetical protein
MVDNSGEPMLTIARRHERDGSYAAAYHSYFEAAEAMEDLDKRSFVMMQGVRCLQKNASWRALSASWEFLGSDLGRTLDANEPQGPELYDGGATGDGDDVDGRLAARRADSRFFVISDWQWLNPEISGDGLEDSARLDAYRRQRQAWAYEWAAEEASTGSQFADAARLYRRAGVAWERSRRPDRWARAASCYHSAALSATRTAWLATRRMIVGGWCAWCVREKDTESVCPVDCGDRRERYDPAAQLPLDGYPISSQCHSDIERIAYCWRAAGRGEDGPGAVTNRELQLADIQRELARQGNKQDARSVRRFRTKCRLSDPRWTWIGRVRPLRFVLSRLTTSPAFLAGILLALYVFLLPLAWWVSGSVHRAGSRPHASYPLCIVYSLQSIVTFSNSFFAPGSSLANALQAIEALSAYFALGAVLWISLRSYED